MHAGSMLKCCYASAFSAWHGTVILQAPDPGSWTRSCKARSACTMSYVSACCICMPSVCIVRHVLPRVSNNFWSCIEYGCCASNRVLWSDHDGAMIAAPMAGYPISYLAGHPHGLVPQGIPQQGVPHQTPPPPRQPAVQTESRSASADLPPLAPSPMSTPSSHFQGYARASTNSAWMPVSL